MYLFRRKPCLHSQNFSTLNVYLSVYLNYPLAHRCMRIQPALHFPAFLEWSLNSIVAQAVSIQFTFQQCSECVSPHSLSLWLLSAFLTRRKLHSSDKTGFAVNHGLGLGFTIGLRWLLIPLYNIFIIKTMDAYLALKKFPAEEWSPVQHQLKLAKVSQTHWQQTWGLACW